MAEHQKFVKSDSILKFECDIWVNQRTGEVIETTEIMKPISRQGFMITYLTEIIKLIDELGNKKMQIVKYILENMDKSSNSMFCTVRELSEWTKTSKQTVQDTLKILERAGIIQRRTGGLMVNPKLIHRGSNTKEKALLTRFYEFVGNEGNEEDEQTD